MTALPPPEELAAVLLQRLGIGPRKIASEIPRTIGWIKEGIKGGNVPAVRWDPYWNRVAQEAWSWGQLIARGIDPRGPEPTKQNAPPPAVGEPLRPGPVRDHLQAQEGGVTWSG